MKKTIIHTMLALAVVALASCTQFLKEIPRSQYGYEQYFSDPAHARNVINWLYRNGAQTLYNNGGIWGGTSAYIDGYMSGFFRNEYEGQELDAMFGRMLEFTPSNFSTYIDKIWNSCYKSIGMANTAIKYIPVTPGLEDTERRQLLAQAKFFRAFAYFALVKRFGDVPLITEPYEKPENMFVARTPLKDVYGQITRDLNQAIDEGMLADVPFTQNKFRISKTSVQTLLADVYLTMAGYPLLKTEHYADAARVAKDIITGGKHSLMTNDDTGEQSAYNKIRTLDNSTEYMYSLEYLSSIEQNKPRPEHSIPLKVTRTGGSGCKLQNSNCAYYPFENHLLGIYSDEDLRGEEKQFFHTSFTHPTNPDKVIDFEGIHAPYLWYDKEAVEVSKNGSKDMAIYRYAEVLLIAAEAIARSTGVDSDAQGYLTDVKERAFPSRERSEILSEVESLSKDDFIKEVWRERMREFPLEFKLWEDIKRTRKYPTVNNTSGGNFDFVDVIGAQSISSTEQTTITFEEKHLLLPLSIIEIQRNPLLVQNPEY